MKKLLFIVFAALLLAPLGNLKAEDWPAWRGPAFTGAAETGNPPTRWTPEQAAWSVELPGKGTSTPVVWKDRIYLTGPSNGQDAVMALDAASGKQLWIKELGLESKPRHRTLSSNGNASPVSDGKGVFVRFRSGLLAALELNGEVRWKINLNERFGPETLFWDQGISPVVTERDVIMARMHNGDSWIAGFDKATGEMRWQQKRNFEGLPNENNNAYTTPVFFEHQGKPAFLIWGADHLTAHAAADGKLLWTMGGFNPDGKANWPTIASPVIAGGLAVINIGRDDRNQASVEGIRLDGSGDVSATNRLWRRGDTGVFCCTPAVYKGRVYLLRNRGEVVCLNPADGKTFWTAQLPKGRAMYYASPLIVNGILYAAREDGVVFAGKAGEQQFELLGENPMGERIIASPVPMGDRILLRGDKRLFCIGAR